MCQPEEGNWVCQHARSCLGCYGPWRTDRDGQLDCTVPRAPCLWCRYDQGGSTLSAEALSRRQGTGGGRRADRRVFLHQIQDEQLGLDHQPAWVQVGGAGLCAGCWLLAVGHAPLAITT